jgi:hypothetical protein
MDKITQQYAADIEESALASEQLSASGSPAKNTGP